MISRFTIIGLMMFSYRVSAQKIIQLYNGNAPGSETWRYNEQQTDKPFPITYNVAHPTLTVFAPDPAIATGTAVIVCPGGGFFILSTSSEGNEVVRWLTQKGITVFLLKYRLGESTTANPLAELGDNMRKADFKEIIKPLIPLAIADGKEAIKYVRAHAGEYHIAPDRVGILGFSAGGTVAASAAFNYNSDDKPDFVAPIYSYMPAYLQGRVAADEPPVFIAAATNDDLGLNVTKR